VRRRPEGEQEAEHERVPHDPVQQRRLERLHSRRGTAHGGKHLAQAEQLEMIDHVGRAMTLCWIAKTPSSGLQALVDDDRPGILRTQHLCADLEPSSDPHLLAVAADR
jgi:hypothetical protein